MRRQGGGAVGDQSQRRSLVAFGQILDLLGEFVARRFRRKIDPGCQHDSAGLDEHRNDRLIRVEAHQVRDDGQKLVWPADLEPLPRRLAATPPA